MKEFLVARIVSGVAPEFDVISRRISSSVGELKVDMSSEIFEYLRNTEKILWANNTLFVSSWKIVREYSEDEASEASCFMITPNTSVGYCLEDKGVIFHDRCPFCGFPDSSATPTRRSMNAFPHITYTDERLINTECRKIFLECGALESDFVLVAESEDPLWLIYPHTSCEISDMTNYGVSPFDGTKEEDKQPCEHSLGLNRLSKITINQNINRPLCRTRQLVGQRSGNMYPNYEIIVSSDFFKQLKSSRQGQFFASEIVTIASF